MNNADKRRYTSKTRVYMMNADDSRHYKYEDLTGQIIKCAFEVHNNLGCGFLEKVYERALLHELKLMNLKVRTQVPIKIKYKDVEAGTYITDIIVEDKVIIEVKTIDFLTKVHIAQLLNYLNATKYEVGLILNFARPRLEYKRVILEQKRHLR